MVLVRPWGSVSVIPSPVVVVAAAMTIVVATVIGMNLARLEQQRDGVYLRSFAHIQPPFAVVKSRCANVIGAGPQFNSR